MGMIRLVMMSSPVGRACLRILSLSDRSVLYMSLWHDSIAEMTPENAAIIDVIMIDVIMLAL